MAVLMVPSSLRKYTQEKNKITLPARNVREALDTFTTQSLALRSHLFMGNALRNFVVVCKNGQDIRLLDGLSTPLNESDEVRIVASIAGG